MRLWSRRHASTPSLTTRCRPREGVKCRMRFWSVWGYLRVHSFVLLQADCVSEGFATDFTRIWPGATVRSADVHLQTVRSWKHLVESEEGVMYVLKIILNFAKSRKFCSPNLKVIEPQSHLVSCSRVLLKVTWSIGIIWFAVREQFCCFFKFYFKWSSSAVQLLNPSMYVYGFPSSPYCTWHTCKRRWASDWSTAGQTGPSHCGCLRARLPRGTTTQQRASCSRRTSPRPESGLRTGPSGCSCPRRRPSPPGPCPAPC